MDEIDIPQYFLCPISLQIMKDPVTIVTGITYDRESIEQWLKTAEAAASPAVCPVTKQPLSLDSDLTPNHMLRRLIQAWCVANAKNGVERIPTPKSPLQRSLILKLIRNVNNRSDGLLNLSALKKLEELVNESERNKKSMADAGVAKAMMSFILRCFKDCKTLGLDQALTILLLTWTPNAENKQIVEDNPGLIRSIFWVLETQVENTSKTQSLIVLKNVIEVASPSFIERLEPNFSEKVVKLLRKNISPQATRAILRTLIKTCQVGGNKLKIIESGAVYDLIEMELCNPEKRTTDLIFCLLANLCTCADGRQQLLKHAGGIAVAAKRLLRVSAATDDRVLCILELIARFSATSEVVFEMLRVGGVSKLCMVLQADCEDYLKKKAREILRLHSNVWSNSPCIQIYLLTRYAR
ncbi:Ubiquitin--protein ligase [Handroanthus impetiginosus]|uniref:U-box domain-containing protein n=1 Tax=Handroanthus impetiginosus TaxID=429701 RepID=A0A2G9H059_9LAMI|nr:Ubiquitin--protein ligase [Handroanthus impetiginosus]